MAEKNDRRRHARIGYDMPLSFSLSLLEFSNLKRSIEGDGEAVDRSSEGIGFTTDTPLEPGDVVRIEVDGSCVTAEVKWVGRIEGKYRVGVLIYK